MGNDLQYYQYTYMNDTLLEKNGKDMLKNIKIELSSKFKIKNTGETSYFLRIQIIRYVKVST